MLPPHRSSCEKVVVIGVGNVLLRDEGVGVHVAQELKKKDLPSGVEVHDGGIAGIGLLDFFPEASKVLLIDAADMNMNPGSIVRFTPEEIGVRREELRFSSHDVGLPEVLSLAVALGENPREVVIIGIQPKDISWGLELSPEVQASVPRAIEAILKEIMGEAHGA